VPSRPIRPTRPAHGARAARAVGVAALAAAFAHPSAATATASAATGTATPACKPAHARTVAANRDAVVFETRDQEATHLWGCRRATGRRYRLGEAFDDEVQSSSAYRLVRLRGHMVGFAITAYDISCKGDCPPGYQPERNLIEVHDLRRRRLVRTVPDAAPLDIAITTRGGVAWTRSRITSLAGDVDVEVLAADSWGRRTLDRGSIDARSLTSELTIVSWLRDGIERFARLR